MTDVAFLRTQFGLEGRVALVTGGRQGIGEAISEGLARAGAAVAVTSRDRGSLRDIVRRLRRFDVDALALELNLGDPQQIQDCAAEVVSTFGHIDIAVNNAGLSISAPALEYSLADWDSVLATNLRGAFLLSQALAPAMCEQGHGRIVNLSSPFARVGVLERVAYSASKAGLEQMTRSLAVEWAAYGITVNAVAPTTVVTETRAERFRDEAVLRDRIAQIPLGRVARADEVVGAVLLLSSRAGAFITGQTLLVDGGYSVRRT